MITSNQDNRTEASYDATSTLYRQIDPANFLHSLGLPVACEINMILWENGPQTTFVELQKKLYSVIIKVESKQ